MVGNGGENSSVAWYENMDGEGTFGTEHTVVPIGPRISSIAVDDIDGDGYIDIVTTASQPEENVSWYKNIDGQFILTSTLKDEEYSDDKYSKIDGVNAVDYSSHQDCKILNKQHLKEFLELMSGFEGIIL